MKRQKDLVFGKTMKDSTSNSRFAVVTIRGNPREVAYMMEKSIYGDWGYYPGNRPIMIVECGSLKSCRDAISRDWKSVKDNLHKAMKA